MTLPAIRTLGPTDSLTDLTELLHRCYAPLHARGLNYVAASQDVETTKERIGAGTCFVAEANGALVGTVVVRIPSENLESPSLFRQPGMWMINQLAVDPPFQGIGLGKKLLEVAEDFARQQGGRRIALDTAIETGATRQNANFYKHLGYWEAGVHRWPHARYKTVCLTKSLVANRPLIFREAAARDIPAVVHVIKSVYDEYGFPWEPETYHADLYALPASYPPPERFWLAEWDGAPVATAAVEFFDTIPAHSSDSITIKGMTRVSGTNCSIDRVYVHPDARRRGIARELTELVIAEARAQGGTHMEIWSDIRFTEAHALYQSFGARIVAQRLCDDVEQSPEFGMILSLT